MNTLTVPPLNPSHKKWKGSLDQVLFAAKLEFRKVLSAQATSEQIKCKHEICWEIITVFFM